VRWQGRCDQWLRTLAIRSRGDGLSSSATGERQERHSTAGSCRVVPGWIEPPPHGSIVDVMAAVEIDMSLMDLRLALTLRGPVLKAWPGEFGRADLDLGHRQGLPLERLHHADCAVDAFWFPIERGMQ
jgi:hypothetical protein